MSEKIEFFRFFFFFQMLFFEKPMKNLSQSHFISTNKNLVLINPLHNKKWHFFLMPSLLQIVQIVSIIASGLGAGISILTLILYSYNYQGFVICVYVFLFCACLLLSEIYIPGFFKYFGFLLKNWGKAFMYILLGFLFFNTSSLIHIITGIAFWALSIFYVILSITANGIAKPLLQNEISLQTTNADYYVEV